jgi:hypothetical protein
VKFTSRLRPVLNRGNPAPFQLFLNFHAESSISLVRMNVIGSRLFGCERLESPGYETRKSCSTGPDIVSNNFSNAKTPFWLTRHWRDHDKEKTSMLHFTTRTGGAA